MVFTAIKHCLRQLAFSMKQRVSTPAFDCYVPLNLIGEDVTIEPLREYNKYTCITITDKWFD